MAYGPTTLTDMTSQELMWWFAPPHAGRIEQLRQANCHALLASRQIGRLGYLAHGVPRIVPLNYLILADSVTFRTSSTAELVASTGGQKVCLQVDHLDEARHAGRSVLVTGYLHTITPEELASSLVSTLPQLWPDGRPDRVIRIEATEIAGRMIQPNLAEDTE